MKNRMVLAKLRLIPTLAFYGGMAAMIPVFFFAAGQEGFLASLAARALAVTTVLYWSFYVILGLYSIVFLQSDAVYTRDSRIVYVSPLVFNVAFSNVANIDVDHTRENWGLAPTVRVRRKRGRDRYIRTEFLNKRADELAEELRKTIAGTDRRLD